MKTVTVILATLLCGCQWSETPFRYAGYETGDSFYNGEILLPDMVHDDTLVVVNAYSLNMAINSPDMIFTDAELSATIHRYCVPFRHGYHQGTNAREYQIDVDHEGATLWDGDRLVGFLPYDSTEQFHQMITDDNQ